MNIGNTNGGIDQVDLLEEARMLPPKPAPRVGKGLKGILIVVGAFLVLIAIGNVAALVTNRNGGAGWRPLTMTKAESDDYARQQSGQADFMRGNERDRLAAANRDKIMGNAKGLAGDPYDESPGGPKKTAAQDAAEHAGNATKSEAELARERLEAEAIHRRQNSLDSAPAALDFSDYFEKRKETALLARAMDHSTPENRDAYDALDAAAPGAITAPANDPISPAVAAARRKTRGVIEQALNPEAASLPQATVSATETKGDHDPREDYVFDSSFGKLYRLMEDTILETVLVNRLAGASNGPVITMVDTDVYSSSGSHLLIPKGTRLLGTVSAVGSLNQERLFVAFHRAIMPDGYSVSLDKFKALDVVGQTGLRDLVNHHYAQIFGASLAVAAVGAVAQVGNNSNFGAYDWGVEMRNGITQGMAQSAQQIMQRFLNILPTFTIRERSRVKIMLSSDLLLPDIKNHIMDPDL